MHKHKLGLAEGGRALVCVLPDCRTSGKPFVVAVGDSDPGDWNETKIISPDISLCDHELPYFIVGRFIKYGDRFCIYDGGRKNIYKLPNCFGCGWVIRIQLIFAKNEYKANRFCTHCGAQVMKDGELITA